MHSKNFILEPSRHTPVSEEFDVIVVGGGIAGVSAAIASARNSSRVCLIEKQSALGGLATLGNVTLWLPLCDGKGTQVIAGLGEELLKLSVKDLQQDNITAGFKGIPDCWQFDRTQQERTLSRYQTKFNPATYMLALEELIIQAGVILLYDTRFCSIHRDDNRISHIIVENKNGRSAMGCKVVIDATGDADVCFSAGESTLSLYSNVPAGWFYTFSSGELKLHVHSNKYSPVGIKTGGTGPFFRGDDATQITAQILATRKQIREKIKTLCAKNNDYQLIMPATVACFRMTRRLIGQFTLKEKHIHNWFEDAIGLTNDWRKPGPVYSIPLGCLRGTKTNNLLTAGRCISVDNSVWDVTRSIPSCVVTGEAAGTIAALSVAQSEGNIDQLDYLTLRKQLLKQGVLLNSKSVTL
jgi:FAD dependent oxidoreductase